MHDVAIIGGGLAGLALSIELSSKGFDVVLFEKNHYPFHKVCGEYISNESLDYLAYLGVNLKMMGAAKIDRFSLSTSSGARMSTHLPFGGIGISRYTLDNALASISRSQGTTILENTTVLSAHDGKLETTAGDFSAKVVLGAQGKRSIIDKQLHRPFITTPLATEHNFIGVKYHVKADLPKDLIELHLFKNGYCGISAIEEDKYCLCYLSKASNLKPAMSIEELESNVLSQNPILKDYFSRFENLYDQPKVISQVNFQNKEKGNPSILFAGDAAGLIAPLSGNGMSMALHSAHLLQAEVVGHLKGQQDLNGALSNYTRQWNAAFGNRFSFSRWMQRAFFSEYFMESLVKTANIFPPLAQTIIKQTHGEAFFEG